jgi:KUP system potassium uptake protein
MGLALGAVGVVYGDIGTSPLYAMKEAFSGHLGVPLTKDNILGVLSLIFWSLNFLITFKYLSLMMRADNRAPCSRCCARGEPPPAAAGS